MGKRKREYYIDEATGKRMKVLKKDEVTREEQVRREIANTAKRDKRKYGHEDQFRPDPKLNPAEQLKSMMKAASRAQKAADKGFADAINARLLEKQRQKKSESKILGVDDGDDDEGNDEELYFANPAERAAAEKTVIKEMMAEIQAKRDAKMAEKERAKQERQKQWEALKARGGPESEQNGTKSADETGTETPDATGDQAMLDAVVGSPAEKEDPPPRGQVEHPASADAEKKLKTLPKAERRAIAAKNKAEKKALKEERRNRSIKDATADQADTEMADAHAASTPANGETVKSTSTALDLAVEDPQGSNLASISEFSQLPDKTATETKIFKSFSSPTPIQAATWPHLLAGRDLIGVAETGSGKTLAFAVPCIRRLTPKEGKKAKQVRAVMVSPTRELAVQISEQVEKLAEPAGLKAVCVYGGVDKEGQKEKLKKANIIVATPGRLNDLMNEGFAKLEHVDFLVLDEADRMLEKGFEEDIRRIIGATKSTSAGRQTCMFTATWPQSVRELAATFLKEPVKVIIGDNPTGELRANSRITQTVEVMDNMLKNERLLQLIKKHQSGKRKNDRILVFCLYKKEASRVEQFLLGKGLRAAGIHGDLSQSAREASLESFKSGKVPILVATDVAARGLDIPAVKLVINVTFPLTVEDYVHRIGRTGRAGQDGMAYTFFTEHDKGLSGALINVLKQAKQDVPEELMKFGTTVKRKEHGAYGAFFKSTEGEKKATKITFD